MTFLENAFSHCCIFGWKSKPKKSETGYYSLMKLLQRFVFILCPLFFTMQIALADDQPQVESNGVIIVTIGERKTVNEMAIYPRYGIANRPLLIAAHGNGGAGPKEIEGWLDLAKQHHFTIVCPTFLSAVRSMLIPDDAPYFKDCLHWIENNLQYDKSNAYMTGFSGGGYAVWYLGTTRPDFFKGLFLQSGNFAGNEYYDLNLSGWANKPIHLVWGSEDSPTVIAQNKQAVDLLQSEHFTNFSTEIIPGAHHQPHHDLVVTWMEQQMTATPSN